MSVLLPDIFAAQFLERPNAVSMNNDYLESPFEMRHESNLILAPTTILKQACSLRPKRTLIFVLQKVFLLVFLRSILDRYVLLALLINHRIIAFCDQASYDPAHVAGFFGPSSLQTSEKQSVDLFCSFFSCKRM